MAYHYAFSANAAVKKLDERHRLGNNSPLFFLVCSGYFMDKHWLTIIIVLIIIGVIVDGVRRMRRARQNSIRMSLRPRFREEDATSRDDDDYGSEFPNGGARASDKQIDPELIQKARKKYGLSNYGLSNYGLSNYGVSSDSPTWGEKVAAYTGLSPTADPAAKPATTRIEPYLEADPLLDDIHAPETECKETTSMEDAREPVASATNHAPDATTDDTTTDDATKDQTHETPTQASLDFDTTVPMLMDALEDDEVTGEAMVPKQNQVAPQDRDRPAVNRPRATPGASPSPGDQAPREPKRADRGQWDNAKPSTATPAASPSTPPTDILAIHLKAPENEYFYGSDLLELILNNGLRFGAMEIFHHHAGEDGEGPVLFSMANMVKPGTFELPTFETFSTLGLSFFITLPTEAGNPMRAFDTMLSAAQDMAGQLGGELNDEQHSVLTRQTIEHYRERIRDFSRRQQLPNHQ